MQVTGFDLFQENRELLIDEIDPIFSLCLDLVEFREMTILILGDFSKNLLTLKVRCFLAPITHLDVACLPLPVGAVHGDC